MWFISFKSLLLWIAVVPTNGNNNNHEAIHPTAPRHNQTQIQTAKKLTNVKQEQSLQKETTVSPAQETNTSFPDNKDSTSCTEETRLLQLSTLIPVIWIGLAGNTLAFYILQWKTPTSVMHMLLKFLAVSDNAYLAGVFLALMFMEVDFLKSYR